MRDVTMKKTVILISSIILTLAPTYSFSTPSNNQQHHSPTTSIPEKNKKIVIDFYQGVFQKHQVKTYADKYIGDTYIQHNPYVENGKAPFINYFTEYFKKNPSAKNSIKRVIAEGDLVMLHVHSTQNSKDRGQAIVDIFRIKNDKIVEHWDVIQNIPEKSANSNSMF